MKTIVFKPGPVRLARRKSAEIEADFIINSVNKSARLLNFEATRDLPLKDIDVQQLIGKKLAIAPILQAELSNAGNRVFGTK